MIDPASPVPVHVQLTDEIRDQIERGKLPPGGRLLTEPEYMDQYEVGRNTVRRALATLRNEGLIVTTRQGSRVRSTSGLAEVTVSRHTRILTRMPSETERRRHGIPEGVPLFIIERDGEEPKVLLGDRTALRVE